MRIAFPVKAIPLFLAFSKDFSRNLRIGLRRTKRIMIVNNICHQLMLWIYHNPRIISKSLPHFMNGAAWSGD
jgi:hypothetical protein